MTFANVQPIVINGYAGASTLTDFPLLIAHTYPFLATTGNGGGVQNASGFDVGFYADAGLTTKLAWETELYTPTTGKVIYWVKIPSLAGRTTVIYMAWGDASISTDQSNKTGTWNSAFKGVWHLPDVTGGAGTILDSTGLNNASPSASPTNNAAGQVGGAATLNGTSQFFSVASPSSLPFGDASAFTVSAWVKTSSAAAQTVLATLNYMVTPGMEFDVGVLSAGKVDLVLSSANLGSVRGARGATSVNNGAWRHIAATYDGSGANTGIKLFVDGAPDGITLGANTAPGTLNNSQLFFGRVDNAVQWFAGSVDEIHIANVVRSNDWLAAEFSNQNNPSAFISFLVTAADTAGGTDAAVGTTTTHRRTAADTAGGTDVATRVGVKARLTVEDMAGGSDDLGPLIAYDSFNRTNTSSLGSTNGPGSLDPVAWSYSAGGTPGADAIASDGSGAYEYTSAAGVPSAFIDTGQTDVDITIIRGPGTGTVGIIARYSDDSNHWTLSESTTDVTFFKLAANAQTVVFSASITGVAGDTLRLVVIGNNWTAYRNGVVIATTTDSFNNTRTKAGFTIVGSNAVRVDSFMARRAGNYRPGRLLTQPRTGADTAGASDAAVRSGAGPLTGTAADTAGGTDTATRAISGARTATDTAGATDAATRTEPQARTGTDTAGATDAATRSNPRARTSADTAGATDAVTRTTPKLRTSADTAGATDVATRVEVFAPRVAFDFAHTDSSWLLDENGSPLLDENNNPLVEGTPAAIDVATGNVTKARTGADTAGATDAATRTEPKARAATDTAGATDVAGRAIPLARTSSDTAGATDSASRSAPRSRSASDTAGATDTATRHIVVARTATDTAGATDSSTRSFARPRTAADVAGGTDTATRGLLGSRAAADTVGGTDAATTAPVTLRATADVAGGTDAASRARTSARSTTDTAGATDTAARSTLRTRATADNAGGTDAATRTRRGDRTSADTSGCTDSATRVARWIRTGVDTAGPNDVATARFSATQHATDTAGGTDLPLRSLHIFHVAADTAGGTDVAALPAFIRDLNWVFGAPTARWVFAQPSARWAIKQPTQRWTFEGADQ